MTMPERLWVRNPKQGALFLDRQEAFLLAREVCRLPTLWPTARNGYRLFVLTINTTA